MVLSPPFSCASFPSLMPIRYDVQLQLPTASDADPLVPTFFGTALIDFQLQTTSNIDRPMIMNDSTQQEEPIRRVTLLAEQLDQFENCSMTFMEDQSSFPVSVEVRPPREGVITYGKGIFYRDAGGLPLLGTDLFLGHSPSLFPQMGGALHKTTTKLALVHPQGTTALSTMPPLQGTSESVNKHWRVTRFVQAPNIAAHMLSLAVLPDSIFEQTLIKSTPSLAIWTNRLLHPPTLKQQLAKLVMPVFETVSELLGAEPLPLSVLNLVVISDEFNGTHSFGLLLLPLAQWDKSDEAHRVALLARLFARQWLGGVISVGQISQFCLQEDIVEWLTTKTVQKLLKNQPEKVERYQLAQYVRLQLAETFLAPGESVMMPDWAGIDEIFAHCALKGAQLISSLEQIAGERVLLQVIQRLIAQQRYRSFGLSHFVDLLRPHLADSIDLGQVFEFWFRSGGIPNLLVEKREERVRLRQLNEGRQAQLGGGPWAKMSLWPLPIAIRNISLPFKFMLSQVLELAPVDRKLIPLTNDAFAHLYRVNYDGHGWERIVRELGSSLSALSARTRAQLLGDFCYFNAVGQIVTLGDQLKRRFLKLLTENYEHFELCEFYAFWCTGGRDRRIPMDTESRARYMELLQRTVFPALWNEANYECGGPSAANDAGNELCKAAFGKNCF
uniref:Peptidase_M1 domain-containing protein n=1 Tax=Globodera pallida TaxID=36090 RepID=A0A183CG76_GLOPA